MSSPFLTRSPTNVNVLMSQLKAFDGLLKNIMYVLGKNFNGENNISEKFTWCNSIL